MPSKPSKLPRKNPLNGARPLESHGLLAEVKKGGTSFNKLSVEIWREVLLYLQHDRRSVLAFIQTSRFFYGIGIRVLIRKMSYSSHRAFNISHMNFWCYNRESQRSLHRCPLDLDFSVQPPCWDVPPSSADLVDDFLRERPSPPLYKSIMSLVQNFVNLRTLRLHDTTMPPCIYIVIGHLRKLNKLVVERCTFQPTKRNEINLDLKALPLVSLTLRGVREMRPDHDTPDADALLPFHLACGSSLRELSLSWTKGASRFFSGSYSLVTPYSIPKKLLKLHILATPESNQEFTLSPPDDELSKFIIRQKKLEQIRLDASHFLSLPPLSLPSLQSVSVAECLEAPVLLAAGGRVRRLEVTGNCYGLSWLEDIADSNTGSNLSMLAFKMFFWEPGVAEVVQCVCSQVEQLDITVDETIPASSLSTLSITLPKLQKMRLSGAKTDSAGGEFFAPETERILRRWNRTCPLLRLVQLSSRNAWQKKHQRWIQS